MTRSTVTRISASAQGNTYTWKDIDCGQSRIAAWPGLKCRATNPVIHERKIGAFQRGGYESLSGGILCAPTGQVVTEKDISLFIDGLRLQPASGE